MQDRTETLPKECLNFLHSKLEPIVWCSAVGDDGYPAENLISSDIQKFVLGFMAYAVEKPPIELVFTLCCPITLHSVRLWTRIGSLKTTGLEIYVIKNENANSEFVKVGSCFDLSEDIVEFNLNFSPPAAQQSNLRTCKLFRTLHPRVPVKKVKVCIKTTARCTPVLQKIEILGVPHRSASKEQKRNVWQRWNQQEGPQLGDFCGRTDISSPHYSMNSEKPDVVNLLHSNFTIPDDLLDSLTYEIMSLPMILPSGKIVDKSSLDRHAQNEEAWGRPPSDPFTGVAFTSQHKPILNVVLKSKIDRFLLQNVHQPEMNCVPRTVGGGSVSSERSHLPYSSYTSSDKKRIKTTNEINETVTRPPHSEAPLTVESTIDEAVRNALKNITRFTVPVDPKSSGFIDVERCFTCAAHDILYRIQTCTHFVCRTCLLKNGAEMLCFCGTKYSRSDIVKFYKRN